MPFVHFLVLVTPPLQERQNAEKINKILTNQQTALLQKEVVNGSHRPHTPTPVLYRKGKSSLPPAPGPAPIDRVSYRDTDWLLYAKDGRSAELLLYSTSTSSTSIVLRDTKLCRVDRRADKPNTHRSKPRSQGAKRVNSRDAGNRRHRHRSIVVTTSQETKYHLPVNLTHFDTLS